MIEKETAQHFNDVSPVWENKIWVNDEDFDKKTIEFAQFKGDEIVLDIGIGTGALAQKLPVKEMYGLDISQGMMERNPLPRQRLVIGNGEKAPFMDNTFDVVTARNLLKHVEDPIVVIKEMRRVLKPKGKLLIIESIVYNEEDREIPTKALRVVEPYHPPFQSMNEYLEMVKGAGFIDAEYQIEVFR